MTFQAERSDTLGEQISYVIAVFSFFVTTILLPLAIITTMAVCVNVLKGRKFKKVMGVLYRPFRYDRRWSRSFYFLFIARRLLFVLIVFKIKMPVITQLLTVFYGNLLMTIYQGLERPSAIRKINRMELFNEWQVLVMSAHMIFFTAWIDS